jgi:D-serine deaminase-like pyridoxal phosphate-dependent protein
VAKVSEAESLAKAGLDNILITGPVVTPGKIERLIDLLGLSPNLLVVVDHPANIELLDTALHTKGLSMGVLLDVDVGSNRTGVRPTDAMALAGQIVSRQQLHLRGIQAYAGHVQHIRSYDTRKHTSHECLQGAARVFREIRASVPTCTIFSASGTGTFDIDLAVAETSMSAWIRSTLISDRLMTIPGLQRSPRPYGCSQRLSVPTIKDLLL